MEVMNLARLGNKYLAEEEPWKLIKTDQERTKTVMYIALQIAANLSIVSGPFIPFTSHKLKLMLSLVVSDWSAAGSGTLLSPRIKIQQASLLFRKVEDAEITTQIERLEAIKFDNHIVVPQKKNVSFEDFTSMDIRIGTITAAKKVKKTKKLLMLTVDTGIDSRTIVSGIAEHFSSEEILGKQVSVLVNLSPRKIKGIESQGMILMAKDNDGSLRFITPSNLSANGSVVS